MGNKSERKQEISQHNYSVILTGEENIFMIYFKERNGLYIFVYFQISI